MRVLGASPFGISGLAIGVTLVLSCSDPPLDEFASGGTGATSTGGIAGAPASGGTAGASGGTSGTGATSGASGSSGSSGAGAVGGGAGTPTGGSGGSAGSVPGDRSTPEGTCARWNGDRADLSEGTWSGNVAACEVGDISPEGRANALKLINLYRWLADLPAVATDPERDRQAQACSLMMEAEGELSHNPSTDWACYGEEGAEGASSSNISGGPGVVSIDRYMLDQGNATTIGHRRWTLSNSLGPIGLGSTDGASCFQNLRGSGRAGKPWMAWPPPGIVPLQAFGTGRGTIDDTGWTIQSDDIDLDGAAVAVMSNGADMPVTVTELLGGYGSDSAIRFNPDGWSTIAGQTYAVSVTGIETPISYEVVVVDCGT
jgi:hypothetical protein